VNDYFVGSFLRISF